MNKQEFIAKLQDMLSGLPKQEVEERLNFYSEMIYDRMEEGLSEEQAVSQIGSVEKIASQIIADIPFAKIAKGKIKSKNPLKVWEIILLALGSPIWFSLLIVVFAVVFSIYVSLWAVVVSMWAVFVSLIAGGFGGAVACVLFICQSNVLSGFASLGAGAVCLGLSILLFFGCKALSKGAFLLIKACGLVIKKGFIKRRNINA